MRGWNIGGMIIITDSEQAKYPQENVPQCLSVYHKSRMDFPGIKSPPQQ
jgi:hypothetical protein